MPAATTMPDPPRRARSGLRGFEGPLPSAPRISALWWLVGPVSLVMVLMIVGILAMHVPYVTLSPGGARPVEDLVEVKQKAGGPKIVEDPPDHDLLYLTVSVGNPTGLQALIGVFDAKTEVEPSAPYRGTQSPDEDRKLNLALMSDSQDKARKVALERLGYKVVSNPIGAFLQDVDPSFPVAKVIKPGATVVAIDGKDIPGATQLVAAIQAHKAGDQIRVTSIPLGSDQPVTVTARLLASKDPANKGTATLGVSAVDRFSYTYPIDIEINTQEVGGPSAGLSFTLAILDRLTRGDLLGKERVAVTGTIELDGSVGPVGGVRHKAEAAISQGAKLMIVPKEEYAEAKKAAGSRLHVEAVTSLDQALAVLKRYGGDPLPVAKAP